MYSNIVVEDLEIIKNNILKAKDFDNGTVLVTGCAGFLGFYTLSVLVRHAAELKVKKVIGLDTFLLGRPDWVEELLHDYPDVLSVSSFDIAKDGLESVVGADTASYVIHAASIASPPFYRKYPLETIDANIWGLRQILEFYRENKSLKGLLFYSSSEIYGDPDKDNIPTSEEYRGNVACQGPRACYDESKRFGETLCWVYANHHQVPITIARPFNNYGPGMGINDKRLPADLAKSVSENKDLVLFSDGTPTRTFCYISDAITGYLLCLLSGSFDVFNIGMDKPETSVQELANLFAKHGRDLFDYSGEVKLELSTDPNYLTDNPNRRCPVIDKARDKLSYNPTVLVDEGVRRYLAHIKQELSK